MCTEPTEETPGVVPDEPKTKVCEPETKPLIAKIPEPETPNAAQVVPLHYSTTPEL